ncbi:MAG: PHP domain-containing protein [Deltaproteobacteria bacterium]|nr:PHP domain-containing protein [Deltaproteobacteria bacterium]
MADIDLHTHSTASDGTLPPGKLIREAARQGLKAIALTDHDTTAGLGEALRVAHELGMELIPGVELSVDFSPGFMHLLGLWLAPEAPKLNAVLADLRHKRDTRNERIVSRLNELGIDITYDEVRELAGEGSVGRPHLAQILVRKGVVSSVNQAFAEFLGSTGRAYIPKEKLTPERAVEVLLEEGATVILAHPYSLYQTPEEEEMTMVRLKNLGMTGIEAYYSLHDKKTTKRYLSLAKRHGLLPTSGSDFHGYVKPDISLGVGQGNLTGPYALLQALKDHRTAQGLPC